MRNSFQCFNISNYSLCHNWYLEEENQYYAMNTQGANFLCAVNENCTHFQFAGGFFFLLLPMIAFRKLFTMCKSQNRWIWCPLLHQPNQIANTRTLLWENLPTSSFSRLFFAKFATRWTAFCAVAVNQGFKIQYQRKKKEKE